MRQSLKILLLEDNPSDAKMVQRLLQKEQFVFDSFIAVNRDEYLCGLEQFLPDLIISDNTLPGFNATEALEIYHQRSLSIPFILVTGTVSEEFAAGIIKLGADDYILKDRLARLPAAIENALVQRQNRREKQETLEKLKHSEKNLLTIFKNTSQGFILIDRNYTIKSFNENARKYALYNSTQELATGRQLVDFLEFSQVENALHALDSALTGETTQSERVFEKGASQTWLHYSVTPVRENGSVTGICITISDITEIKETEQRQFGEQRKVSRAIITAQERERHRLGQELHDNINQILAGIKIYLDKARKDHSILEGSLKYPMELIDSSMQEIRMLCKNLVTPFINSDMRDQLQLLLNNLSKTLGIHTSMEYDVKHAIDNDQKLNMYRIFQEQVNNIIKHAQAKNVAIQLKSDNKFITIMISDDGLGFDLNQERKGIGFSNMINRVESFHGSVLIETAPNKGCKINISIPQHAD